MSDPLQERVFDEARVAWLDNGGDPNGPCEGVMTIPEERFDAFVRDVLDAHDMRKSGE